MVSLTRRGAEQLAAEMRRLQGQPWSEGSPETTQPRGLSAALKPQPNVTVYSVISDAIFRCKVKGTA